VRFLEIPASRLEAARGLASQLQLGAFTGLIVRGFVSTELANATVTRLSARQAAARKDLLSDDSAAFSLGMTLITSRQPDLSDYFESAAALERSLPDYFEDAPGFEARLRGALQTLAGSLALSSDYLGRRYPQLSIRCVPHDAELRTHADLEQRSKPAFAELEPLLLPESTVLSYFVLLSAAAPEGDRLSVYSIHADKPIPRLTPDKKEQVRRAIEQRYRRFRVPVAQGDLIVFDAGRNYHRVQPDPSPGERWTLGGFLGFGADGARLYGWA
jgi:hypothetical protein